MFESAFLKVKRANHHVSDLRSSFNAHIQRHTYILRPELNPNGVLETYVEFSEGLPSDIPVITGDAVHNLRSALDHATWELIGLDGGKQNSNTSFPSSMRVTNQIEYEALCKRIETPRSDTKEFFMSFAAYPGGRGDVFHRLHELNRIDKHRGLTLVARSTSIDDLKVTYKSGNVVRLCYNQFHEGTDNSTGLILSKGERILIEADKDTQATIEIFLCDVPLFKGCPLIDSLVLASNEVRGILGQFRDFVLRRQ